VGFFKPFGGGLKERVGGFGGVNPITLKGEIKPSIVQKMDCSQV
jgi:hypothetical protein